MKNIKTFELFEMSKVDYNEKLRKFFLCFDDITDLLNKEFSLVLYCRYKKNIIDRYFENDKLYDNDKMQKYELSFYEFYMPPKIKDGHLNLIINAGQLEIIMYSWKPGPYIVVFKSPISQIDGKEQIFLKALVESIKNKIE